MPELPEVETVKRVIEPQIIGQQFMSVAVANPQIIAYPDAATFESRLTGQVVQGMSRRGKFLTVNFRSGDRLIIHLRMTGQLLVTPPDYPTEKHTHFIAELSEGNHLRYIDVRRFGRMWYLREGESDICTGQHKLGHEPEAEELTGEYLRERLDKRSKSIKEMLLDQSIVAGIGNIYANEILFAAGIHPEEKCADLNNQDWQSLADNIKDVIEWAIEANEISQEEYLAGKGKEYRNTPGLQIYDRGGQPCNRCGAVIEKIIIGGRSSYYCPACQQQK